jgi:hypothetical protein
MRNSVRGLIVALLVGAVAAPLAAQDIRPLSNGPSREGFFLGLGLAGGQFDADCSSCGDADPASAFGSHIRLGGTLSPKLRLGVDLFGIMTEDGIFADLSGSPGDAKETAGDATVSVWFYPSAEGNFWLQAGLGGVAYIADVDGDQKYSAVGGGLVLGLGYDFRVGRNGSITPYLRFAGSSGATLKDEDGNEIGGTDKWKTNYVAIGVDYVFH